MPYPAMGRKAVYEHIAENRMFSDPFTAVMALILLAFIGTLAIFFRIWRELDALRAALRDIRESLRFYAVDSAQQNRDLAAIIRELRSMTAAQGGEAQREGDDCLGELLERGLPNLALLEENVKPESLSVKPASSHHALAPGSGKLSLGYGGPASGRSDDDDLIRRLGNGLGTDAAPK